MLRNRVIVLIAATAISSVSAAAHADTVALTVIDLNQAVTPVNYTASAISGITSLIPVACRLLEILITMCRMSLSSALRRMVSRPQR